MQLISELFLLNIFLFETNTQYTNITDTWQDDYRFDTNGINGWHIYKTPGMPSNITNYYSPQNINFTVGANKYHGAFDTDNYPFTVMQRYFKCTTPSIIELNYAFGSCNTETGDNVKLWYINQNDFGSFKRNSQLSGLRPIKDPALLNYLQVNVQNASTWGEDRLSTWVDAMPDDDAYVLAGEPFLVTFSMVLTHNNNDEFGFMTDIEIRCVEPSSLPTMYTNYPTTSPTTISPTTYPTFIPTYTSFEPSYFPTHIPSENPSQTPTEFPSTTPTNYPTHVPSENPSQMPTEFPSGTPSYFPTRIPSENPSQTPTDFPSGTPTNYPTHIPSQNPSQMPTEFPSRTPSYFPTRIPSENPSETPSEFPSGTPTNFPTKFHTNKQGQKQSSKNSVMVAVIIFCLCFLGIIYLYYRRHRKGKYGTDIFVNKNNNYIPLLDGNIKAQIAPISETKTLTSTQVEFVNEYMPPKCTPGHEESVDINRKVSECSDAKSDCDFITPGEHCNDVNDDVNVSLNDNVVGVDIIMDNIVEHMDTQQ